MTRLSKAKLADRLDQHGLGYSKQTLVQYTSSLLDILSQALCEGEDIRISKFGNLQIKEKMARTGRNPQTQESIILSRRRIIRFQSSPLLHKKINHV